MIEICNYYPELEEILFEALSEVYLIKPNCPIQYLGQWLLNYTREKSYQLNRNDLKEEKSEAETNKDTVTLAAETKTYLDLENSIERISTLKDFLAEAVCDPLVHSNQFGVNTAWAGKCVLTPEQEELHLITADKIHRNELEGKKLLSHQGIWSTLSKEAGNTLFVKDVTLEERIYFFGIPRFGSLFLLKFYTIQPESEVHFHIAWQLWQKRENNHTNWFNESIAPLISERVELVVAVDNLGSDAFINCQKVESFVLQRGEKWDALQLLRLSNAMELYEALLAQERELVLAFYRLQTFPEVRRYETDIDALELYYATKKRHVAQLIEFFKTHRMEKFLQQLMKMETIMHMDFFKLLFYFTHAPIAESWMELRTHLESVVFQLINFDPSIAVSEKCTEQQRVDVLKFSLSQISKKDLEAFSFTLFFIYELLKECIETRISFIILKYIECKKEEQRIIEMQMNIDEKVLKDQPAHETTNSLGQTPVSDSIEKEMQDPKNLLSWAEDISPDALSQLTLKYNI